MTKNSMIYRRAVFVALCVLMSLSPAWGLGGNEHAALWNDVFGIVDTQSQQAIQPLWKAAQEVIDEYVDDYRELHGASGQGYKTPAPAVTHRALKGHT